MREHLKKQRCFKKGGGQGKGQEKKKKADVTLFGSTQGSWENGDPTMQVSEKAEAVEFLVNTREDRSKRLGGIGRLGVFNHRRGLSGKRFRNRTKVRAVRV